MKEKKDNVLPFIVKTNHTIHDMSTLTIPTIMEIPVEAEIEIRTRVLICKHIKEMYKGENEPTLDEILGIVANTTETNINEKELEVESKVDVLPSLEGGEEMIIPSYEEACTRKK